MNPVQYPAFRKNRVGMTTKTLSPHLARTEIQQKSKCFKGLRKVLRSRGPRCSSYFLSDIQGTCYESCAIAGCWMNRVGMTAQNPFLLLARTEIPKKSKLLKGRRKCVILDIMGETLQPPKNSFWIKQAVEATFNFMQAKLNCSLSQYGIQDSQGLLEHARMYV